MLIGTNHLYRPRAWKQIGGYQDSIIEDHLTGMRVQATVNPITGHRWKGIYTPDVLAVGEGPTTWSDYFNQQKRWSYGIWEIILSKHNAREGLTGRQRLLYGCVQLYYPSVAIALLLGNVATAMYLLFGVASVQLHSLTWLALWSITLGSWFLLWFWLRRFNLAEHERTEVGTPGIALALFAGPVYLSAAASAIARRPLAYAVTAKGRLRSSESLSTFHLHLCWAALSATLLTASFILGNDYLAPRMWSSLALFAGLTPPLMAGWTTLRDRWGRKETQPHRARGRLGEATGPPRQTQTIQIPRPASWPSIMSRFVVVPVMTTLLVASLGATCAPATPPAAHAPSGVPASSPAPSPEAFPPPGKVFLGINTNALKELYPGDDEIDWIGLSGYYGTAGTKKHVSSDGIFSKTFNELAAIINKPIVITETGATNANGERERWIREMFQQLPNHPNVIGVIWFERSRNSTGGWPRHPPPQKPLDRTPPSPAIRPHGPRTAFRIFSLSTLIW